MGDGGETKCEICYLKLWQEPADDIDEKFITATSTLEDSVWEVNRSKN